MADRLATLLETESTVLVFEELLVAQEDIRSIGKTVDTLLMEFDQQAFEAYHLQALSAPQLAAGDQRSRQGAQRSLLYTRSTSALPNRVMKRLNPYAVTSHRW